MAFVKDNNAARNSKTPKTIKAALSAWTTTTDTASGSIQIGESVEAVLIDTLNTALRVGAFIGFAPTRDKRSFRISVVIDEEKATVYAANDDEALARLEELQTLLDSMS